MKEVTTNEYKKYYVGKFTNVDNVCRAIGYDSFDDARQEVLSSNHGAEKFLGRLGRISGVEDYAVPNEKNESVLDLDNLTADSLVFQGFKWRNPYWKAFGREKRTSWGSTVRVTASGEINAEKWIRDEFVPKKESMPKQYSVYLYTTGKNKFPLTIQREVLHGAFTNMWSFDEFVSDYLSSLERTIHMYIFNLVGSDLRNVVTKFTVDESVNNWIGINTELSKLVEDMCSSPTSVYNAGIDPNTKKQYDKLNNINDYSDLVIIMNPKIKAIWENKVLPYLIKTLKINPTESFQVITDRKWPENEFTLVTKLAYYITARIELDEGQYFINNTAYQQQYNLWLINGIIPFNQAFVFSFAKPTSEADWIVKTENIVPNPKSR